MSVGKWRPFCLGLNVLISFCHKVWDISGDSLYDTTRAKYSKGANGFLMVFDATNVDSFVAAEQQLKELDMCGCDRAPKLLVGNKVNSGMWFLRYFKEDLLSGLFPD